MMTKRLPGAWTDTPFRQDLQQVIGFLPGRGQRKNTGYWAAAVRDLDGLAFADHPQVLAQAVLEFSTCNGHHVATLYQCSYIFPSGFEKVPGIALGAGEAR